MTLPIDNPVSSFEAGIIGSSGVPVGICIKFRYFNGEDDLTHWPTTQFHLLMAAMLEYIEEGGHEQFMFMAKDDPVFVGTLPARHPYHTLLTEKPDLTAEEVGAVLVQTRVESSAYVDRGRTFVLRPTFRNGSSSEIYMHEYTAFSLWGYLNEYVEAYDKLSGPHHGGVH